MLSHLTRRILKAAARKVADAVGFIYLSRENRNPYDLDYHAEDCDEPDLFNDDDSLISDEDAADYFGCSACAYQYQLWSNIVEATGGVEWGRRAFAALDLDDYIENFQPDMSEIDAAGWNDVKAVRSERARLDAQRQYNQQQESEQMKASR